MKETHIDVKYAIRRNNVVWSINNYSITYPSFEITAIRLKLMDYFNKKYFITKQPKRNLFNYDGSLTIKLIPDCYSYVSDIEKQMIINECIENCWFYKLFGRKIFVIESTIVSVY